MNSTLTVCLITYNHSNYIRQAIDSVLMQKVNFSWELVIADDYSTDGTREILLEYKERHPDLIHLILQKKNVGAHQNWIDLLSYPRSKYIAYFEGDDYWIDPYKLQKQVDFLEKNNEFVVCAHNSICEKESGDVYFFNQPIKKNDYVIADVIQKDWFLPTASLLFKRSEFLNKLGEKNFYNGDYHLQLILLSKGGKLHYMNDVMSVYRIHKNGLSQTVTLIDSNRKIIELLEYFDEHTKHSHLDVIQEKINRLKAWNILLEKENTQAKSVPYKAKSKLFMILKKILQFLNPSVEIILKN